jgi:predicted ABC-type ATPase
VEFNFGDQGPLIVAIAGPNGAGKTTFYRSHLADIGLRFVNADDLAREFDISAYEAAEVAAKLRTALVEQRESFIFETVLSDPIGDKVQYLCEAVAKGYQVVLIFIHIADVETSIQRVSMRVAQGGHNVPDEKLRSRFQRIMKNLELAIGNLPWVVLYDNSDPDRPFQLISVWRNGKPISGS